MKHAEKPLLKNYIKLISALFYRNKKKYLFLRHNVLLNDY
jgi:hypothetical protein